MFGIILAMNKAKIVKLWAELGESRPGFDEFERAMTRPVRTTPYGLVDLPKNIAIALLRSASCI